EFTWPLMNMLVLYLPWALLLLIISTVPAIALSPNWSRVWSILMTIVAVYCWTHSLFAVADLGLLDGKNLPTDAPDWVLVADLLIIVAGILAVTMFTVFRPAGSTFFLIAFVIITLVQAIPT